MIIMLIGKKMKICELKKILVDYGVPKDLYNFDGTGRTDERFCIERVQEGWNVFGLSSDIVGNHKIHIDSFNHFEYT